MRYAHGVSPLDALVLDYGVVLTCPQPAPLLAAMAAELGATPAAFGEAYWAHRLAYDLGLPAREYWERVMTALGCSTAPGRVERLIAHDVASWTVFRDEVWEIARDFRARGGRTAILSNGNPEIIATVRARRPLAPYFDAVVVSCEVGVAKPDARIYALCLERLGVPGPRALFVDDRTANVEGARRAGLRALLFDGDAAVERLCDLVRAGRPLRGRVRASGPAGGARVPRSRGPA